MGFTLERFFTYDGGDHTATRVVLWATAALVTLVSVVLPLVRWFTGAALTGGVTLDPDRDASVATAPTTDDATAWWSGDVTIELSSPSTWERLASLLPGLGLSVAVVVGVLLALRLLDAVRAGEPFRAESARTLHRIALLAVVTLVVLPLAEAVREATFAAALQEEFSLVFRLPITLIVPLALVALVASALASAFQRGAALEAETEGLV